MYTAKDKYIELIASGANPKDVEQELLDMMDEEWLQRDNENGGNINNELGSTN